MLVIRRRRGTKIFIDGGRITLTVTDVQGDAAKIGLELPRGMNVAREELMPDGASRCCRCGGTLPPAGSDGLRVKASTGCHGDPDPESDRCRAFAASALWGDTPAGPERREVSA